VFLDCNFIEIGDDAQIGPGVHIYTAFHQLDSSTRRSGLEGAKPVTIGNSVWLGGCCVVGPGVSIGDNTVIGAGSVVVRDIPANKLAVGNPCRVVRPNNLDASSFATQQIGSTVTAIPTKSRGHEPMV